MPRYAITGPIGPEQLDYPDIIAATPREALYRLHLEALGKDAVRIEGDRLIFADPANGELCSGLWRSCRWLPTAQSPASRS
jgi:hypothetical protein